MNALRWTRCVSLDWYTRETPAQRHSATRRDARWTASHVYDAHGVGGSSPSRPTPVVILHKKIRHEGVACYCVVKSAQDLLTCFPPWKSTTVNRQKPGQRGAKVSVFLLR
jgi:hypothetical protein